MAKVVLENISKSFPQRGKQATPKEGRSLSTNQVRVLNEINLTVNDGEFMVLVGPSGCGKSTLLRLMAGLEEATAGKIWVGDREVTNLPPKDRDMAMVFQNYALYPHLKVYDNIAFGLRRIDQGTYPKKSSSLPGWLEKGLEGVTRPLPKRLRYLSSQETIIDARVQKVAESLQITPLLDRLPKELSGGQKQRVALGRAIARNPQVFLMDEPMSNLDAKLRTQTRSQIVKLQKDLQITTIYVTHDQIEAMTMGDRIAVMNKGEIQQIASPLQLYNHPANCFVAEFIGSPPMNFLTVKVQNVRQIVHRQFSLNLPSEWETYLKGWEGRSLLLGIRPEHLTLSSSAPENLQVQVDLVENLGNESYICAHLLDETEFNIQVRLPSDYSVKMGDILWLSLALEKIHLFDSQTERNIKEVSGLLLEKD